MQDNTKNIEGDIVYNVTAYGDLSGAILLGTKSGENYCMSVVVVDGQPQLKLTPQEKHEKKLKLVV